MVRRLFDKLFGRSDDKKQRREQPKQDRSGIFSTIASALRSIPSAVGNAIRGEKTEQTDDRQQRRRQSRGEQQPKPKREQQTKTTRAERPQRDQKQNRDREGLFGSMADSLKGIGNTVSRWFASSRTDQRGDGKRERRDDQRETRQGGRERREQTEREDIRGGSGTFFENFLKGLRNEEPEKLEDQKSQYGRRFGDSMSNAERFKRGIGDKERAKETARAEDEKIRKTFEASDTSESFGRMTGRAAAVIGKLGFIGAGVAAVFQKIARTADEADRYIDDMIRSFAYVSGAHAAEMARNQMQEIQLRRRTALATAESAQDAAKAMREFRRQLQPLQAGITNIKNRVSSFFLKMSTKWLEARNREAEMLRKAQGDFVKGLKGDLDPNGPFGTHALETGFKEDLANQRRAIPPP